MSPVTFDISGRDAQAMPVTPVDPAVFDVARYEAHAAEADARYAAFLRRPEGIAVWQRVRVAEVFRDGCRDMAASLRWQLGGLTKALGLPDRRAELPRTVVRHWRHGGRVWRRVRMAGGAGARGAAALPHRRTRSSSWLPVRRKKAQIMRHVLAMIDYFLEETGGRIPMSWSDLQNPLNTATELVETSGFFEGFVEAPDAVRRILATLTDELIRFTGEQSRRIGDRLVRPGHGFASARSGSADWNALE